MYKRKDKKIILTCKWLLLATFLGGFMAGCFLNPHFNWAVPNKLVASSPMKTRKEFEWVIHQGIIIIVTVREIPLPSKYLSKKRR